MRSFPSLPKTLAVAALATAASACGDAVTDPSAFTESAEAEAVLRSAASLPALPALIDRAGDPPDQSGRLNLFRAQELWAAGVADQDDRARARRRLAVRYAAPVLIDQLAPEDWDATEQGLRAWIATAESMLRHITLPRVEGRLRLARVQLDRAAAAPDAGARARALLLAGAELVETTPRFVARAMAVEADAAVRRAVGTTDRADRDLQRAVRLKDWAARAVEEGDYLVAMQRAYYALQLVEAR
ncbi:MAG TPA: hypothetical protein VMM12_00965 [Longimicrobiales bacterium]|nr:hypothetical protein [Longimicrobiales bacterium]